MTVASPVAEVVNIPDWISPAINSRLVADTGSKVKSPSVALYLKNLPSPRLESSTSLNPVRVLLPNDVLAIPTHLEVSEWYINKSLLVLSKLTSSRSLMNPAPPPPMVYNCCSTLLTKSL